jgi:hypothetical protein
MSTTIRIGFVKAAPSGAVNDDVTACHEIDEPTSTSLGIVKG